MGRQNTASGGCGANLRLPPSPGPLLKRVFLCLALGVVLGVAKDNHSVMRLSFFLLTTQPATPQITSWVSSLSRLMASGSSDARRFPIFRAAINHCIVIGLEK